MPLRSVPTLALLACLLLLFAGATFGRFWNGAIDFDNARALWRLGIGAVLSVLPTGIMCDLGK